MPNAPQTFDIAVIGAGIAGASVATELAPYAQVVLLEQEATPGYHTTGRSAAIYSPIYGPQPIRALTRASLKFYMSPPEGFCDHDLLRPINAAFIAREDQAESLAAMEVELSDASTVQRIDATEIRAHAPLLRDGYAVGAMLDSGSSEIDVAALHQGYLRQFRANGGTLLTRAGVTALRRDGDLWQIATPQGQIAARTLVNAAGAWADQIGAMAGAETIGLVPKRRTALMIEAPAGIDVDALPLIIDADEEFYLKPDAGKLLISPANEDPEPPCDVQPDEMDIAICIDRIERAFDVQVRRIDSKWAGLRSFVADKSPVAGFSDQVPGFYWLAGQGGYGIQSAPGLSRFAAAEILGQPIPADILAERFDPSTVRPGREGLRA